MKIIGTLIAGLVLVGFSLSALAAEKNRKQTYTFEGQDITALVEFFRPTVKVLKTATTVYNWSSGGNSELWQNEQVPNDAGLVSHARELSGTFWRNFGRQDSEGNMFGFGLYAAVDPVYTFDYGGGGDSWVLLQLNLPVGFKMIDVNLPLAEARPNAKALEVVKHFECPIDVHPYNLFVEGGKRLNNSSCHRLVKDIFDRIFQIDGFVYNYSRTDFTTCKKNQMGARAFVITRPQWMNSENIGFYTTKTRTHLQDRIRIQTLFIKAKPSYLETKTKKAALEKVTSYLNSKPNSYVEGSLAKCEGAFCSITVRFCEDETKKCDDMVLDLISRPGGPLITASQISDFPSKLLWSDLEGKPKETTIDDWMKKNLYLCSGEAPFVPEKDEEQGAL